MDDFPAFDCPHCGGQNYFQLDASEGRLQEWTTDCEICCRPIIVSLKIENGRIVQLDAGREND